MTETEAVSPQIGYADAVAELDEILAKLDDEDIDIDLLSELVARAAELISVCRGRISTAQQQVTDIVDSLDPADPPTSS